jgi:hypothetical protein
MYDVFISYARSDKPRAAQFQHAIKRCGWTVWWDADLLPGQQWNDEIERELRAAGAVVVLWSKDSVQSQFVRDEATIARELNKLVPVTLDGTRPKVGMGQLQLENMSEWDGIDSEHPGLIRVLQGIRHITKTGHVPVSVPATISTPAPAPTPAAGSASAQIDRQNGPQKSSSKAIVGVAAAVVVVAAGIIAFPYLGGGTPPAGTTSGPTAPPPSPVEPTPVTRPAVPPTGGGSDSRTKRGGDGGTSKSGAETPPAGANRAAGKNPLGTAAPPEAKSTGAMVAAPTAERGCATLIAATRKRSDDAEGFFDLGKCHFAEGRFNDSVSAYNAAIDLNDNVSRYFEARGLARWKNDMAAQGINDLKSAIELKPTDATLYETRGQIYFAMRRYQEAQDDYSKATSLNAKSKRAWLGLAEAAEKTGSDEIATAAKAQASALP